MSLPVSGLRADFRILRKTLEEAHPGLYWYSSKPAMNAYFDSTYSLIKHDMNRVAYFKLLLPLIARIRCLHTNLTFSKPIHAQALSLQKGLPFRVLVGQNKVYIQEYVADSNREGYEIKAINHQPVQKLVAQFLRYLPADGYNVTYPYDVLSHGGFGEAYALLIGQPEQFVIDAVDPILKKPIQFTVKASSQRQIERLALARRQPQPVHNMALSFSHSSRTAVLTINTFEINNHPFTDSIQAIFKTIRQARSKHLIIDVRRNGGGNNSNVTRLFSYLAQTPFTHLQRAEMITQRFTYLNYVANLSDFRSLRGTPTADGTYLMSYLYLGSSPMNPVDEPLRFNGKLIVLASGATVSAASEFVALVHATKRGVVVGEETGGGYYGATGGRYLKLILPHSQLQAVIPTIRILLTVPDHAPKQPPGRGVIPDYEIRPTISDVLAHNDVQLEAAKRLIGKN